MAKHAKFEPKRSGNPSKPWLVNLPAALSSTGKRERRYFDTQVEAHTFGQQQKIRSKNFGTYSTLLPAGKVDEAAAAFERLKHTGASLVEAVEHYIKWRKAHDASVSLDELLTKFADAKRNRSKPYLAAVRQAKTRFALLAKKKVSDITSADIDDSTVGMTMSVRNAFLRVLRAAFNFAIRRCWCATNPVQRVEMAPLTMRREVLSNSQVESLLRATVETDIELLPYQLFCLFAGVRPEEVTRLTWSHVDLREKWIHIPEESSKTGTHRNVRIEPVFARWLHYVKQTGLKMNAAEPVAPKTNLRKRLRAVRTAAGITNWPQDAPRRTYASCWLAVYDDQDKLNRFMGHTSPAMLFRHYHRAVTDKQAKAFWKIEPPSRQADNQGRKIVPFPAKAA